MAETKVTKNEIEPQEAWIPFTLQNNWLNYGNPFATAAYMKDSMGFVHLKGMVKSGTANSTICTLPAGYRPAETHYMAAISNGGSTPGILNIGNTGTITVDQGNTGYISLSSVTFRAEA